MSDNDFRLITLGTLALRSPTGEEDATLARRRFKLALLAVLALAERPLARDALLALFWPEQDEKRARHSLSDALSHLRRVLGPRAISTRRAEVALTEEARLEVDAVAFAAAVEARDDERALELYDGPFLDAVHLAASHALEEWCAHHRARCEALFVRACARRCETLARSRAWDACGELALRWLAAAPLSADAALFRLNALKAPGTPDADRCALDEYEHLVDQLAREYGRAPDPAVTSFAADLAARCAAAPVATLVRTTPTEAIEVVAPAADAPDPPDPPDPPTPTLSRQPSRRSFGTVVALAVLLVAGGLTAVAAGWGRAREPTGPHGPVVAIVGIADVRGDTSTAWMSEGLGAMIAAKLARAGAVDAVPPERVREVRARARWSAGYVPTPGEARDVGSRVGATWVVTGGLARGDTALVLDLVVRDVASGRVVRLDAVSAPNVIALADAAAARVLAAAGAAGPGPRLADVETANLEAFAHYARFTLARSEARDADARRELDAAIALDSGFVTALRERVWYALADKDRHTVETLAAAFRRNDARATDWDRLLLALTDAFHAGAREQSEALGRALVHRYPNDPRAYETLRVVYSYHGQWQLAERAALAQLRIDSLATEAGTGPCVPCAAYRGLADVRLVRGDYAGAVSALQRLLALEPALSGQWLALSAALAADQRYPAALEAARRAVLLSDDDVGARAQWARVLIEMRRLDEADSLAHAWARAPSSELRDVAMDLRAIILREEGRYRAADATLDTLVRTFPSDLDMTLVLGDGEGRSGDYAAAERTFERFDHVVSSADASGMADARPERGDLARAFAWHHALEADAIAASGDTVRLRALADSIERVGAQSYYGRDWVLHHHVRALVAMRGGRYAEAAREFAAARWGGAGWTRTTLGLAEAQLALGDATNALATLRTAYAAPLDGMGRYLPRSEIDAHMADAFTAAGQRDSAAVYVAYVARARRRADSRVAYHARHANTATKPSAQSSGSE